MIIDVEGHKVVEPEDLAQLVSEKLPGEKVELTILRDNKRMQVTVTLGKRPDKVE